MSLARLAAAVLTLSVASPPVLAQGTAPAPKVVLLEVEGDARNTVRGQVAEALGDAKQVELVSLRKFEDAADKKKIPPTAYTEASTLSVLGPPLGLSVVVAGELAERFTVRIFDLQGQQVWTKELPLVRGKLSADNARRLASAIAAAASAAPPTPPQPESSTPAPDAGTPIPAPAPDGGTATPETGSSGTANTSTPPPAVTPPRQVEAVTLMDLQIRPPFVTGRVAGTTTWRSYCSRPGVNACKQWDDLPDGQEPSGETQTFTSSVPYVGYLLSGELFPLSGATGWWNGFGVGGTFGQAFSLTTVRISTPNSSTPDRTVTSVDMTWSASLLYRWYFGFGGLPGYVGGHAGYRARDFSVDPDAGTLLGGSHRSHPAFGVDARLPLAKLAQVELSASYFLNPRAGEEELAKYGTSTRGTGFLGSLALTGEVWGPLGYSVRASYEGYWDEFTGAGTRWTNGGAAQESYLVLSWGVTGTW